MTVLKPTSFLALVDALAPEERFIYYKGYIGKQRTLAVCLLAEQARILEEAKVILLATKRTDENEYSYYAIKCKRGEVIPSMMYYAEQLEKQL